MDPLPKGSPNLYSNSFLNPSVSLKKSKTKIIEVCLLLTQTMDSIVYESTFDCGIIKSRIFCNSKTSRIPEAIKLTKILMGYPINEDNFMTYIKRLIS